VLVGDRGLCGVIDVGQLAVADPALDLQPAWNLFTPRPRGAYREALGCEEDEWERGKGWAFAQAIGCLWYYRETNPVMSRTAHRTLQALLDAG
jgi:aminoglycoside phosphotransferase (APT) family kinase protein